MIFSFSLSADDTEIDRLLREAENAKSKNVQIFSENLALLDRALEEMSREQYFFYTYLKGYQLIYSGKSEEGIGKYYESFRGSVDVDLKVKVLTSIINIRAIKREFSEGYAEAGNLIALLEASSGSIKHHALLGLAIFYNKADDFASALNHVYSVIDESQDKRLQCFAQHLMIESRYNLSLIESGNDFVEAHNACKLAQENVAIGITVLFEVRYMTEKGQSEQALTKLQSYESLILETKYSHLISDFHSSMANLLLESGFVEEAKHHASLSIDVTETVGVTEPRVRALEILAIIAEKERELSLAIDLYKRYSQAEKAYLDDEKAKQLAVQQAKHQAIVKSNQIALLDKENAVLKAEARVGKEERLNIQLIASMFALLAVATFMWAHKNRRMHQVMRERAQTDELTRIANRSHFSHESEHLLSQRKALSDAVSFVIFDLDFFKQVNDNHGHMVGDWVLKHTVQAVKPILRNTDVFGRLGGEEFAIVLEGCGAEQALAVAEDCRAAIENLDCSASGAELSVTASFGVADSSRCGYDFDTLYGCADHALYQSKHAGRNQVYLYEGASSIS